MLDLILYNPAIRFSVLGILFALVAGGVLFAVGVASKRMSALSDIRDIRKSPGSVAGQNSLTRQSSESVWSQIVYRVESLGLHLTDTKQDELRRKLIAAGYDAPSAPKIFTLTRLVLTLLLPGAYLLLELVGAQQTSTFKLYLYCAGLALAGLYFPNLLITAKADRRREAIVNGFPDCLDLLLVCVEAGLGLESALDRVGREMAKSHPLVARILITATLQLRAGASREVALRGMAEGSGVEEIRSFATLLIQSDKLGTSIATTLRVYAAEMREKRRMRAEEKAHRLPVLISIPLVTCMLPVMIGVLMLPAVIRVIRQLAPALSGG